MSNPDYGSEEELRDKLLEGATPKEKEPRRTRTPIWFHCGETGKHFLPQRFKSEHDVDEQQLCDCHRTSGPGSAHSCSCAKPDYATSPVHYKEGGSGEESVDTEREGTVEVELKVEPREGARASNSKLVDYSSSDSDTDKSRAEEFDKLPARVKREEADFLRWRTNWTNLDPDDIDGWIEPSEEEQSVGTEKAPGIYDSRRSKEMHRGDGARGHSTETENSKQTLKSSKIHQEVAEERVDLIMAPNGKEYIFRASIHKRGADGLEMRILETQGVKSLGEVKKALIKAKSHDGKWWLTMAIVCFIFAISPIEAAPGGWQEDWQVFEKAENTLEELSPKIQIRSVNGSIFFEEEGRAVPEAGEASLLLHVEWGYIRRALLQVDKLTQNKTGRLRVLRFEARRVAHRFENLQKLFKGKNRKTRELLAVAALIMGVQNKWQVDSLTHRVNAQEEAGKLIVKQLKANEHFTRGVEEKVEKLANDTLRWTETFGKRMAHELLEQQLFEEWVEIEKNATAVARILESALEHRLSKEISVLIDMNQVWQSLSEDTRTRDERLPDVHWHALLTQPVDWFANDTDFIIVAHIPTKKEVLPEYKRFRWMGGTVPHGRNILDLYPINKEIAVDKDQGAIVLDRLADCSQFGDTKYCKGQTIREAYPNSVRCLTAIWRQDFGKAKELCHGQVRKMQEEIRPIGKNHWIMATPKGRSFRVTCRGESTSAERVQTIEEGLWEVILTEDCQIKAPEWSTHQGSASNATIVTVDIDGRDFIGPENQGNETKILAAEVEAIRRPISVPHYEKEIMGKLEERGWKWGMQEIFTTTIAAAGLIAATVLIFFICRGRLAKLFLAGSFKTDLLDDGAGDVEPGNQDEADAKKLSEFNAKRTEMLTDMLKSTKEVLEGVEKLSPDIFHPDLTMRLHRVTSQIESCGEWMIPQLSQTEKAHRSFRETSEDNQQVSGSVNSKVDSSADQE